MTIALRREDLAPIQILIRNQTMNTASSMSASMRIVGEDNGKQPHWRVGTDGNRDTYRSHGQPSVRNFFPTLRSILLLGSYPWPV